MYSQNKHVPRVMIAGTNSGCGKTTITCAILKALVKQNMKMASFKCGPDYIDPMFHRKIIGAVTGNLDIFMLGEKTCKFLLAENALDCEMSLIEGVMGFYDGLGGNTDYASAGHLSNMTETPVVLVVDGKGVSLSIVAVIKGFLSFSPNKIKGVIINRVSEKAYLMLKEIIESHLDIKVLGFLPAIRDAIIESRHLGLITADEIEDIEGKLELLASYAERYIDIDGIVELAKQANPLQYENIEIPIVQYKKRIAVAYDHAFCFYYQDNFSLLKKMGAEIIFFSPLYDKQLPAEIDALILGGGYPENYLQTLSENKSMLIEIKNCLENGLPCIAECGGFMYLHETIDGIPMVGFFHGHSYMTDKLTRFGYMKLTAATDNLLCKKDEFILAHEFHYSDSDNPGDSFKAEKPLRKDTWFCAHATEKMYAGYPHIHLWGNIQFAQRFMESL